MLRSYGMGWGGGGGPIPLVLTLGLWTLDLGLIIEQWKYFTDQKVESGAFSEIKRFRDQRMEIDCCDIFTDCQGLADFGLKFGRTGNNNNCDQFISQGVGPLWLEAAVRLNSQKLRSNLRLKGQGFLFDRCDNVTKQKMEVCLRLRDGV